MQHQENQKLQVFAPLSQPFAAFAFQAATLGAAVVLASALLLPSYLAALLAYCVVTLAVGQALASNKYPHGNFGLCNSVTLFRAALVCFLFGALFGGDVVSAWLVFGVASFALALDGVDGWLARRAGLQSDFGARFDVETDAALAATLALWLMISGTTGFEVLVLGFIRYVFVFAGWFMPNLRAELPPSFRRKLICVVQITALILLTIPFLPDVWVMSMSIGASALLCYSFAVDLLWLLRRDA